VPGAKSPRHLAYGAALRSFRVAKGLSQEALAHDAGLDRTYVAGIERGERNPTLGSMFRIADALRIDLSEWAKHSERG
jgi:transcriptional regulator with XRE-family HTH domain